MPENKKEILQDETEVKNENEVEVLQGEVLEIETPEVSESEVIETKPVEIEVLETEIPEVSESEVIKTKPIEEVVEVEPENEEAEAYDELYLEEEEATVEVLEPVQTFEKEYQDAQKTIASLNNKILRLRADQQNLRRRHNREKKELQKYGAENVLKEIVLVMDDLDRALIHLTDDETSSSLLEGIQMVHRKFIQTLKRLGVIKIEAKGTEFDPNIHEALQQVEDKTIPHNHVTKVFQSGFMLHDRLLRPALVVVGRGGPKLDEQKKKS